MSNNIVSIEIDQPEFEPKKKRNSFLDNVIYFADSIGLRYTLIQYRWGRKLFKGDYYLIQCNGLRLNKNPFWSDEQITSCQSQTLGIERY